MIIQSLSNYYDRLSDGIDTQLPRFGFGVEKIHFVLVLDKKGGLLQIKNLQDGKKPAMLTVPSKPTGRTSTAIKPCFAWDSTKYALGLSGEPAEVFVRHLTAFKQRFKSVAEHLKDVGAEALMTFLEEHDPVKLDKDKFLNWSEMQGKNVVFQLDGERGFIHESKAVTEAWSEYFLNTLSGDKYFCLDSGKEDIAADLHNPIREVRNAQPTGAPLISFNETAYRSYGKNDKNNRHLNAPVSIKGAFKYSTVLNQLLRSKTQRIQIGDASTVFWTDRESSVEGMFGQVLNPVDQDIPELRTLLESVRSGDPLPDNIDPAVRFYVLGLSPNVSRLAVRFWHVSTVGELMKRIGKHYAGLKIVKRSSDPEFLPVWRLLKETAVQGKSDNIQPLLSGSFTRAILEGTRYPESLLSLVLERIRAEQAAKDPKGKSVPNVSYARASLIKAFLIRNHNKEVFMSLDKNNKDPGYCCGRLFAVLELIQEKAQPGINSTIRDRFYGGSSTTPRTVFPNLMGLKNHHLAKMEEKGLIRFYESLIGEVLDKLDPQFPAHLNLVQQGSFAIGYYHQRQDIFKGKEKKEEAVNA